MKKKVDKPNFCFICGVEILNKLGFNTGPMQPKNIQILSTLRNSWIKSLRILLNINDENCENVLKMVPFCFSCHELILGVDFMMNTISRFQSRLLSVQNQVKGLLHQASEKHDSPHRDLILEILSPTEQAQMKNEQDEGTLNDLISATGLEFPRNDDGQIQEMPVEVIYTEPECFADIEIIDEHDGKVQVSDFDDAESTQPEAKMEWTGTETANPEDTTNYQCQFCGKRFECDSDVKQHEVLHIPASADSNPFFCVFCPVQVTNTFELQKHVQSEHEAETGPKFQCEQCPSWFNTNLRLKAHYGRLHPRAEKWYSCTQCPYKALVARQTKIHMLIHGEKPFKCEIGQCTKKFCTKNRLDAHQRAAHGEKCFHCSLCPRSFATPTYLKQHQEHHSTLRPYVCEICSVAFKSKKNLIQHSKLHDANKVTGNKPHLRNPRKPRISCRIQNAAGTSTSGSILGL